MIVHRRPYIIGGLVEELLVAVSHVKTNASPPQRVALLHGHSFGVESGAGDPDERGAFLHVQKSCLIRRYLHQFEVLLR